MANKTSNKTTKSKNKVQKGLSDASWGSSTSNSAISVKGMRNILGNLSPTDAYQLCIDVRRATNVRASVVAQGKIRLFMRNSMKEIVGGTLYNILKRPNPYMTQKEFLYELQQWKDIKGERAVWAVAPDGSTVEQLVILNPFNLLISSPRLPIDMGSIQQWQYCQYNNVEIFLRADQVAFSKNFNPFSNVRGCSPLLAGVNEVGSSYESIRYTRQYFANNAMPHVLIYVPTSDDEVLEAYKQEWITNHTTRGGKSWSAMFSNQKVEIETLDPPLKDLAFKDQIQLTTERIQRLYGLTPVHMGVYAAAGLGEDSLAAQNTIFYEGTIFPERDDMQSFLQNNIVDRYFRNTDIVLEDENTMSKAVKKSFDVARDNTDSDIVVILDMDHIPAVAKLETSGKIAMAQKLQDTFKMTPEASADEVGMQLELSDASAKVWVFNQPYVATNISEDKVETIEEVTEKVLTDAQKQVVEDIKDFYRDIRKVSYQAKDIGTIWRLNDIDQLAKKCLGDNEKYVHDAIRCIYNDIKPFIVAKDKESIRRYFNAKNNTYYRGLIND